MIKVINKISEMHAFSNEMKRSGKRIGFVPTMGFLHEGHLSLVRTAKKECDIVVVSIFVNPTQFAPNEDLDKYPRDFVRDRQLLINEGVDAIFYPDASEIYPEGFQTYVTVEEVTKEFEGKSRPTHFRGVTTIVSILFNAVKPDLAVFGQKDAQQATVIKRMVNDLKFDIKIIVAPIVRESDGLAMSSRNVYLSKDEREDALVLSKSLLLAKDLIEKGERDCSKIISEMEKLYEKIPSAGLEYIEIVEELSFKRAEKLSGGMKYYILIACKIGKNRLIDNLLIEIS